MHRSMAFVLLAVGLVACSGGGALAPPPGPVVHPPPSPPPGPPPPGPGPSCGEGRRLRVHVYDVGQALSALVDLPDGRHVLVDTGESPARSGCDVCAAKHTDLLGKLRRDLGGAPIDLVWITHQHSDHVGGAPEVLASFKVLTYVDNGRDDRKAEIRLTHRAAQEHGTAVRVVDPEHPSSPLAASGEVRVTPVVPTSWAPACAHDPNACSILLRIDFCGSSVLFTGDAEHDEESHLPSLAPVTLLQVGHHGSETSTTPAFLSRARPRYAVISSGKPGEGLNADYCHPRALIVERLTKLMGGPGRGTVRSFDGTRCAGSQPSEWIDAPASDRLWATGRDGDVVLSTIGDGVFVRE